MWYCNNIVLLNSPMSQDPMSEFFEVQAVANASGPANNLMLPNTLTDVIEPNRNK